VRQLRFVRAFYSIYTVRILHKLLVKRYEFLVKNDLIQFEIHLIQDGRIQVQAIRILCELRALFCGF
jgi:hypothetical protein